jgi:hypothetical protein
MEGMLLLDSKEIHIALLGNVEAVTLLTGHAPLLLTQGGMTKGTNYHKEVLLFRKYYEHQKRRGCDGDEKTVLFADIGTAPALYGDQNRRGGGGEICGTDL